MPFTIDARKFPTFSNPFAIQLKTPVLLKSLEVLLLPPEVPGSVVFPPPVEPLFPPVEFAEKKVHHLVFLNLYNKYPLYKQQQSPLK